MIEIFPEVSRKGESNLNYKGVIIDRSGMDLPTEFFSNNYIEIVSLAAHYSMKSNFINTYQVEVWSIVRDNPDDWMLGHWEIVMVFRNGCISGVR